MLCFIYTPKRIRAVWTKWVWAVPISNLVCDGFHYLPICTAHTNKIYKNGCTSLLATNSYFSVEINSQKQRFYFVFFQFRYEKVWVIRKLYGRPKTVDPSHTHVTPWLSMCVRAVHGNVVSLYMCIFVCVFFVLFSFLLSLFRSRSLRLHIHDEKSVFLSALTNTHGSFGFSHIRAIK